MPHIHDIWNHLNEQEKHISNKTSPLVNMYMSLDKSKLRSKTSLYLIGVSHAHITLILEWDETMDRVNVFRTD